MAKLSKQDKVNIYNSWKNYHVGPKELSKKYGVNKNAVTYLVALINKHSLNILERPHTSYSLKFKEQAIKPKGRLPHAHQRQANQTGKSPSQTTGQGLTRTELETYNRERICKKIARLSQPADQEPQAQEIAQAVTQLRRELKVSVTFILETINNNPDLPHMSHSNYYYTINKTDKDAKNKPLMTLIHKIYEDNKHRYGYRRIALAINKLGIKVNHKKVRRLMLKMKLFGIRIKDWRKYNSYRGTQGPIKPN